MFSTSRALPISAAAASCVGANPEIVEERLRGLGRPHLRQLFDEEVQRPL